MIEFIMFLTILSFAVLAILVLKTPATQPISTTPEQMKVDEAVQFKLVRQGGAVRVLSRSGRRVRRTATFVERLEKGRARLRDEITGREFVRSSKRILAA